MKIDRFALILSCITFCTFVFQSGCEEQNTRSQVVDPEMFNQRDAMWQQMKTSSNSPPKDVPVTNTIQNNLAPKMTFKKMSHDFGQIRPGSKNNTCEFTFTNTGNANLIISNLENSCGCTVSKLENNKMEYAPGESGKVLADYTDTQLGQIIKHIYVTSNDSLNPEVELAIKAEIVAPIDYEPKILKLSLAIANGGSPKIVVKSLDNQPFSITGFQSVGDTITVKYNPNEKATQFVLEPQVDMEKLRRTMDGSFKINLSHPDCEAVSGTFSTPPRFSTSPEMIIINEAFPKEAITKTINIVSNYDEAFSIQATSSNKGIVNILNTQQTRSGYKVTVEIIPPVSDGKTKMFSDNIQIALPGKGNIVIPCTGYYPSAQAIEERKKCKTCPAPSNGPVRLDDRSFNPANKPK